MNKKLSHLSEKQIQELIRKYYSGNIKIKDLLDEYNIKTTPGQLYQLFPLRETHIICPYCTVSLVEKYQSKNNYQKDNEAYCYSCGHTVNKPCRCKNCYYIAQKRIEEERQEKIDFLKTKLNNLQLKPIELNSLSFEEKVYLGAFLREGISEDYSYINPIVTFNNPLAPTENLSEEIINSFIKKRIIVIHPDSNPDYFENINYKTGNCTYHFYKVKWNLNLFQQGVTKHALIESIIIPTEINYPEKTYELWRKISLYEVLEYLIYSIDKLLNVEYKIGEKTISVFTDLLNDFSVSQIYYIIYCSINKALRFMAEKNISAKHAANTIIGNALSFGEKAKAYNWDLIKYHRAKECPESALSKFFFERILPIGYAGFDEKPTEFHVGRVDNNCENKS